jgi:hypothetical protein
MTGPHSTTAQAALRIGCNQERLKSAIKRGALPKPRLIFAGSYAWTEAEIRHAAAVLAAMPGRGRPRKVKEGGQ